MLVVSNLDLCKPKFTAQRYYMPSRRKAISSGMEWLVNNFSMYGTQRIFKGFFSERVDA